MEFLVDNIWVFILAKMGKLKDQYRTFSIKKLVEEVITYNEELVNKRKINLSSMFLGFDTREGRIKKINQSKHGKQFNTNDQSFMVCGDDERVKLLIFNIVQMAILQSEMGQTIMVKCIKIPQSEKKRKHKNREATVSNLNNKYSFGLGLSKGHQTRNAQMPEFDDLTQIEIEMLGLKSQRRRDIDERQDNMLLEEFEEAKRQVSDCKFSSTRNPDSHRGKYVISVIHKGTAFNIKEWWELKQMLKS